MKKRDLFQKISIMEEIIRNLYARVEKIEKSAFVYGIDLAKGESVQIRTMVNPKPTPEQQKDMIEDTQRIADELNKQYSEMKALHDEIERKKQAPELPKRWEDLKIIGGWISTRGHLFVAEEVPVSEENRSRFASQKEAESALAMAQLSQLMKVYRGKWLPVKGKSRFAIMPDYEDVLKVYIANTRTSPLSFETEKIATQFLNNFRPLINQYFMID